MIQELGENYKFASLVFTPVIKIRNRMKHAFKRFECWKVEKESLAAIASGPSLATQGPCPDLVKMLKDVMSWNNKHVAECNDPKNRMIRLSKSYHKKLDSALTRLDKKCDTKYTK